MADTITSPNMNLPIPVTGVDPGPDYANNVNAALGILDGHTHAPGSGQQITPSGINISSDLPFNDKSATDMKSLKLNPQATPIPNAGTDTGLIYVSGNELYYNDVSGGNQVPITSNGSVNAGAGSISGLPSGTASVTYTAGTYTFQSATNTAGTIDAASVILRNTSPSSKGLTLQPPAAMGADFSLSLPSLPAASAALILDTAGNLTASANDISNAMLAQVPTHTVKGNDTGSTATPSDLTGAQVNTFLPVFTSSLNGLVPASGGGANTFLRADGTFTTAITSQVFTTPGSTTFTVPATVNILFGLISGAGGGGGGGGSNSSSGTTDGGLGGDSIFGAVVAKGGNGGSSQANSSLGGTIIAFDKSRAVALQGTGGVGGKSGSAGPSGNGQASLYNAAVGSNGDGGGGGSAVGAGGGGGAGVSPVGTDGVYGGGGGGGGNSQSGNGGGGGASGEYLSFVYPVTPGQVISYTIGTGGTGGTNRGGKGGDGYLSLSY